MQEIDEDPYVTVILVTCKQSLHRSDVMRKSSTFIFNSLKETAPRDTDQLWMSLPEVVFVPMFTMVVGLAHWTG